MMAMSHFWLNQQTQLISYGVHYRNYRKKNVKKVAFLTVRQKLYQDLLHMDLDILMNQ